MNKQASFKAEFYRTPVGAAVLAAIEGPRTFLVRWQDEDRGWKSLQVIARDEQSAREAVTNAVGYFALEVYPQ